MRLGDSKKELIWEIQFTFDNIEINNNFEIKIQKAGELNECYLLGCYFGNLYLLDSQILKYTKYSELEENIFLN